MAHDAGAAGAAASRRCPFAGRVRRYYYLVIDGFGASRRWRATKARRGGA